MPLPNTDANWTLVGNSVNDDSLPATAPGHSMPNHIQVARILLASQDGGRLRARGCPTWKRRNDIYQDQGGGNGDEDGKERDHRVGKYAQLPGKDPPTPPATRDAGGQPNEERNRYKCCGLPRDGAPNLRPDKPKRLQDRQITAPSSDGANQRVGQRSEGQQREQPGKHDRYVGDAGQARNARGPLSGDNEWARDSLEILRDGGQPGVAVDARGEANQEGQRAYLLGDARIDPQQPRYRNGRAVAEPRCAE